MNQTCKNVLSTKSRSSNLFVTSPLPESFKNKSIKHKGYLNAAQNSLSPKITADSKQFEEYNTATPKGRKVRDIYTNLYDTRNTVFSDQTGKFPTESHSGNKYIMVMVEIDINAVLVEPLKNRKDTEINRAYRTIMILLKRAGIVPKKHILENEVS